MDWLKNWWSETSGKAESLYKNLMRMANPVTAAVSISMEQFKANARKWYQEYLYLTKIPDSGLTPELKKEKYELINRGKEIYGKIQTLGLGADVLTKTLGGVPIVTAGVIATAASLMAYWTYDFIKFKNRLAEYNTMREKGMTHEQAKAAIDSISGDGFFSGLNNTVKVAGVIGGAWILYKIIDRNR